MKKIMFNDFYGLTNAVLQGTKTMTRRLCKEYATNEVILAKDVESWLYYPDKNIVEFVMENGDIKLAKPLYKVGEVVAVAQSYQNAGIDPHFLMFQPIKGSKYLARNEIEAMFTGGWNNKESVRADLMPHQIRITDIKVERLQDISDEDCLKEGVYFDERHWVQGYEVENLWNKIDRQSHFRSAKAAFAALIERPGIGHKGDWSRNPYVFAYTFELIK